jgi:hypothetical protein
MFKSKEHLLSAFFIKTILESDFVVIKALRKGIFLQFRFASSSFSS